MSRKKRGKTPRSGQPAAAPRAARLAEGLACHQLGQLEGAEAVYRQILDAEPDNPGALHYLGVVQFQTGRLDDAAGFIERALAVQPKDADALNNLGQVYEKQGRPNDAAQAYQKAIGLVPGFAEALNNLGNVLAGQGTPGEAVQCYRLAIEAEPDDPEILANLGGALVSDGRVADGIACFEHARRIAPNNPAVLFNFGNALKTDGRPGEAIRCYRLALDADPDDLEILTNLGSALMEDGQLDDAVAVVERALAQDPGFADAHYNLGVLRKSQGRLEDAVGANRRALDIDPGHLAAYVNLGGVLLDLGRLDEAQASYRQAIDIDPDYAEAHHNLGLVLLLQGRLLEGWTEFDWRWRVKGGERAQAFVQALWQGTEIKDKTVLVWAEQGVGDEVMFAGMVPDLVDAGAKVVLECDPRLLSLFRRSFPGARCIARDDPPMPETRREDIDFQAPGGTLSRWLRSDPSRPSGRASYLAADGDKRDALRDRYLDGGGDLLVGVAWLSKSSRIGEEKSMALMDFSPLAGIPGVKFIDLQYGDTEAERRAFAEETGTALVHDGGIDQMADLDAFAAQVAAMDLVVSVSNTTVHVSGALGVPTWVMLNTVPLPVWMLEREDSPWYPSVKLFRQRERGRWEDVIERVAGELAALARG